jgi:hypothetical protein
LRSLQQVMSICRCARAANSLLRCRASSSDSMLCLTISSFRCSESSLMAAPPTRLGRTRSRGCSRSRFRQIEPRRWMRETKPGRGERDYRRGGRVCGCSSGLPFGLCKMDCRSPCLARGSGRVVAATRLGVARAAAWLRSYGKKIPTASRQAGKASRQTTVRKPLTRSFAWENVQSVSPFLER